MKSKVGDGVGSGVAVGAGVGVSVGCAVAVTGTGGEVGVACDTSFRLQAASANIVINEMARSLAGNRLTAGRRADIR